MFKLLSFQLALTSIAALSLRWCLPTVEPHPAFLAEQNVAEQASTDLVVTAYDGIDRFADGIPGSSAQSVADAFRRNVIAPYADRCPEATGSFRVVPSTTEIGVLRRKLSAVRSHRAELIVKTAMSTARRKLDGPAMTICLHLGDPDTPLRFMRGVGGAALRNNIIALYVDPIEGWTALLPYVVAHEYYHNVARARFGVDFNGNGLGTLVHEGRADVFAAQSFPDVAAPWTAQLSIEDERGAWNTIRPRLFTPEVDFYGTYMFGRTKVVPFWAGYRIGFRLVQSFLARHPGTSVVEWSSMSPESLLAASGYNP